MPKKRLIKIEKKKCQPGEPVVEVYAQLRSVRVPLPKIFIDANGYVIQWSDGSRETVFCADPLEGVKDFVSRYVEGMLTFRTKPLLIVDKNIYKEILRAVRPVPEKIRKSDEEIYNKIAEAARSLFGA